MIRCVRLSLVPILFWSIFGCRKDTASSTRETAGIKKLEVEVLGHDYRLYFRYPGHDNRLHTEDDCFGTRDLYVPIETTVQLSLTSRDYVYLMELPIVGVYEAAAPGLFFTKEFQSPSSGSYELLASQMCGYDHEELLGKFIVQTSSEFQRTMCSLPTTPFTTAKQ